MAQNSVSWLEKSAAFSAGCVEENTLEKLSDLIVGSDELDVQFNRVRGILPCRICNERGINVSPNGKSAVLCMGEILIPDENNTFYFACPSLVFHYIKDHHYLSPKRFLQAIDAFDLSVAYIADDIFENLLEESS